MNDFVSVYQNATSQLKHVVTETPKRIKELEKIIKRCELETQDILHLAELESFNACQGFDIAKNIQKVRQKRRKAKDELQALSDLRAIMNNNSKFEAHVNGLDNSLKNLDKPRIYNLRVRTDLSSRFERIYNRRKGETS